MYVSEVNSTQNSKIQSTLLPSRKPDDKRFVKWAEWTWYWQQNKSKQEKRQWDFMFVGWVRSNWPEIAVLKALISSPDFVLKHTIQIPKEMVGQDIFSILLSNIDKIIEEHLETRKKMIYGWFENLYNYSPELI